MCGIAECGMRNAVYIAVVLSVDNYALILQ